MRARKEIPGINAASMADIAFLLLIFFILITKIDNSSGISRNLPPINEEEQQSIIDINKRNVIEIILNENSQLIVNDNITAIDNLNQILFDFILNYGKNSELSDSPKEAVILLKTHSKSRYENYIKVQNEISSVYNQIRNEYALKLYNKQFKECSFEQQSAMRDMFPMQISEAEY